MDRLNTWSVLFCLVINRAVAENDPCLHHEMLYKSEYRGTNCPIFQRTSPLCDRHIKPGWYKAVVDGIPLEMTMSCPPMYGCGTDNQIWMNGSLPSVKEGIVDREVCTREIGSSNCCKNKLPIKVKNCGKFLVYKLKYTDSCNKAYCFGNKDCPNRSSTVMTVEMKSIPTKAFPTNDPCSSYRMLNMMGLRGAQCDIYSVDSAVCDRHIKPGWYKAEEQGVPLDMPTYCVGPDSCGTSLPIWLNDSITLRPYEAAQKQACVRGPSTCCQKTFNIAMKNCGNFNVYYLSWTDFCDSAYCFGQHRCRKEETTTRTDFDSLNKVSRESVFSIVLSVLLIVSIMTMVVAAFFYYRQSQRSKVAQEKMAVDGPVVSVVDLEPVKHSKAFLK